ncbi:MAG: hypothetical protein WD673_10875 [Alphaproteobacteria bacterium]
MTSVDSPTKEQDSAVRALEHHVKHHNLANEGGKAPGLASHSPGVPITFQFLWRSRRFLASLQSQADGTSRLAVTTHIDHADRSGSVVVVVTANPPVAQAKLVKNGAVLFAERFSVSLGHGSSSVDSLIAKLTAVVLVAAPYLDFLSEQQP